jgi:8-oxo-dGTP pyrophosphatase MutT (NUDIX family)
MSARFDRIASETVFEGRIATVRKERYRYEDGGEEDREIIAHPGAVAVVAHDGESIWLVRQPREAVGAPDLLELPAGKLDEEGESPLETAKRELDEEIGKAAATWRHLKSYWNSPGFSDEELHLYLATDLSDLEHPNTHEDERIEVVAWPLAELDALIDEVVDSKTLVGLLLLRRLG